MLFSSPVFFAFFAIYAAIHRLLRKPEHKLLLVILGGTIFYAWWLPVYAFLPHSLTLAGFVVGLWVVRRTDAAPSPVRLGVGIALLLTPLVVFKYTNFFAQQIGHFFGWEAKLVDLSMPLGISFITFTLIAYVIDVWRRRFPVERSPTVLFGYVLFFPHLIAGPILRPHELIPQLRRPGSTRLKLGVAIFTAGLFKKLAIADPIAAAIDPVFADPAAYSSLHALLAMYGFTIQIYCDFSGYSDMAVGLAALIGVRLPTNFRQPYAAASIMDFWRRWHITLSHWLRDYLYIPLGGSRHGKARQIRAVMITMTLGGLWHGANWTFVVWGILHGLAVSVAHLIRNRGPRMPRWLAVLLTFHFVALAWIPFRARDIETAWTLFTQIFAGGIGAAPAALVQNAYPILVIALAVVIHRFDSHSRLRLAGMRLSREVFWGLVAALWVLSLVISAGSSAAFIYFDF